MIVSSRAYWDRTLYKFIFHICACSACVHAASSWHRHCRCCLCALLALRIARIRRHPLEYEHRKHASGASLGTRCVWRWPSVRDYLDAPLHINLQHICASAACMHASSGAALAAFALALCLPWALLMIGAILWSLATVSQCRSILGDKVWMALARGCVLGWLGYLLIIL